MPKASFTTLASENCGNIFGKPIYTIAQEGVEEKLSCLPTKAVGKLQETLQRVVNEGSGTLICIIL